MSETIYREDGAVPGGMPPEGIEEDVERAAAALQKEKVDDPEKHYGAVEHDFVTRAGDPSRFDQGRSNGRTA